ncbi:NAD(P)H-dependent glycerol-3-phosphate dehydrogenase [Alkalibaculum sp. M08DMB]|uniref:Glycerol-3-phosphate dehydrogenase [NAD(P)+] n=1 Tax=Alkalibaculum sporogenes TaxID=2655001 RepID=A0A6A7K9B2_9FIRM|nr:NAD(P)H-dependent glycerol-3-phosphate dehydrogenase [Alkalibaculum sporogenes]MPW26014.1 NAD(P)H-dependent glycerol-3-phosphate dehydrogenase [Alkalibaculum sporogenes]
MGSDYLKIAVIGAGSWGTAIASLLGGKGHNVHLWHRREEIINNIKLEKENKKYLPGINLGDSIYPSSDLELVVKDSQIIVLAVASQGVRDICTSLEPYVNSDQQIINLAKGLEDKTYLRLSQVINEILPYNEVYVLSGPSHAEEVAKHIPTTVVISGERKDKCEFLQDVFTTDSFRVYTNPDIVGVELGGALKNIIALGAGMSDGLGYGDNSKAALMTRGIVEISRLGKVLGAKSETFAGLTGIGDLIVTCTSVHSRNRRAGILLGQGMDLENVLNDIGMVIEGIKATKIAYEISNLYNCDMPITSAIYKVLYENANVKDVVHRMMNRKNKHEIEEINSLFYHGWN